MILLGLKDCGDIYELLAKFKEIPKKILVMLWGAVKDFDLTFIFGFSIKFYTHSCTFYQSAKVFSERFFLLAVLL